MAILPGDDGPYEFVSILPSEADGQALLDYLEARFPYHGRAAWSAGLERGVVSLDDGICHDPGCVLRAGQRLVYVNHDYREPDIPTCWKILERGEDWLAVSKPAGMPVHSTARIFRQALVYQVRKLEGDGWAPAHRLDRDTSGLVLFARSPSLLRWLGKAFQDHRVTKEYRALLRGVLTESVTADSPLEQGLDARIRTRVGVSLRGKPCATLFVPLDAPAPEGCTWVQVRPLQGRLHQIRAHAESLGHPIAGDLLYDGQGGEAWWQRLHGTPEEEIRARLGFGRMWLHARSLEFQGTLPAGVPRLLECPLEESDQSWTDSPAAATVARPRG